MAGEAPRPGSSVERDVAEPLRVPGRSLRRRAALLAGASVLSFLGVVYWGVSSTTPVTPAHVTDLATAVSAPQPQGPAAQPVAETAAETAPVAAPEHTAGEDPSAPSALAPVSDLSALRAKPQNEPPTEPTTEEAPPAQAAEQAAASEAQQNAAIATLEATAQPTEPPPEAQMGTLSARTAAAPGAGLDATGVAPVAAPPGGGPQAAVGAAAPSREAPAAASAAPAAAQPTAIAAALPRAVSQATSAPQATRVVPPPSDARAASATPAAGRPQLIASAAVRSQAQAQAQEPARKRTPLLSVRALPEGARLFLDGQRLPNPFDMRLPEGGKHKLEARYEGYETSSQTVRIESDAKLNITLRRSAPAAGQEQQLQVRPLGQQPPQPAHGAGFVTSNPY